MSTQNQQINQKAAGSKSGAEKRRVVITGAGVVTPIGLDLATFWNNLLQGVVGIQPLALAGMERGRVHLAAQIPSFDPLQVMDRKDARRMDRYCQFAVAAAAEAIQNSQIDLNSHDPWKTGVIIGSGVGGLETMATEYRKLYLEGGPGRVSPLFIPMMIANMAAGQISMIYQAKGSSLCVTTACASGTHAIGEAYRSVQSGQLDVCIAGGAEAPVTPIAIGGFDNMKALSHASDPHQASIPFDRRRDGFIIGEGAGIVVLETLEHAMQRGAGILCEVAGYGSTADAYHITSPDPEGFGASKAMQFALDDASLDPSDVSYINAHGTSTPLNDKYETLAIKRALADRAGYVPVSSSKSMTGHMLGAAGAVEAIVCALAITHDVIPPTVGLHEPDPECDLDYVPNKARHQDVTVALSNSLGFGGHNGTLCFRKVNKNENK